jgi:thioredoxin reductase (NADPH)
MATYHTKFIRGATPSKLEKPDPNGRIKVTYNQDGKELVEEYDTVLFAIGRYALTEGLNLANAGLTCEKNGKFNVNQYDQTNVPHIYAIGDIQNGKLELTPSAIKAGMLLSKRLFDNGTELMDYNLVPTTVFTPLEYGCCGMSEEDAKAKYGAEDISTYHTAFVPLEWAFNKET